MLAKKRSSSYARGTTAHTSATDIRAVTSAFALISSVLPPGTDFLGGATEGLLVTRADKCNNDPKIITSQWFYSSCAAQLRQIVVDHGPICSGIEEVVRFRIAVDLTVQSRKSYSDDLRLCLAEHLASASFAKASRAIFRALETRDVLLSRCNRETLRRNCGPGHETGTVGPPAHRAMAVPTEQCGQLDFEFHRAAKTTARYR